MRKNRKPTKKQETTEQQPKKTSGSFHFEFLNNQQRNAWQTIEENDITFLIGPAGCAKSFLSSAYACSSILTKKSKKIYITRPIVEAGSERLGFLPGPQPLSAKIVTPHGWTTMGELKTGDNVIGRDGLPAKVIGIYPKGNKDIYKVITTDGTFTHCCIDHLWYTETYENKKRNKKGSVKTLEEIIDTIKTKNNKVNHYLPRNEAVHYNKKNLNLSPYVMGVLLGDGCLGESISFASADQDIVSRVSEEVNELGITLTEHYRKDSNAKNYTLASHSYSWKPSRNIRITDLQTNTVLIFERNNMAAEYVGIKESTLKYRCKAKCTIDNKYYEYEDLEKKYTHPLKNILNSFGLLHKKAWEKFVPSDYKYSSIQDRVDLLRGLMDCDGTIKLRNGYSEASFTTTSLALANDVIEIVRSLGGRASLRQRNRIGKSTKLINGRSIISRRQSYEFTISLPEDLNPFYLKRKAEKFKCKYIHRIGIKSVEKVGHEKVQCIKIDNTEHLYLTDSFIVTHNTFEEKTGPYFTPIFDALDELVGPVGFQREIVAKTLEIRPLAYMRGTNLNEAICILDEAQNITYQQMVLYLTRIGKNSKMIINGDPRQSDIQRCCLEEIVDRLTGLKGVGVVKFDSSAIVRNPLISKILERLE